MSIACTVSDSRVMVVRCLRRSLRGPEAFFTALMLPVILMLLFVYVFGGALNTGGKYVDYVVPGLIVLCAGFGAGTTAVAVATDMTNGIVDRFRSMPIKSSSILLGHVAASLAPESDRDRARHRCRPWHRLAPSRLARGLGRRRCHDRAVRPGHFLARGRGRSARPERRGRKLGHRRPHAHPLRQPRLRPSAHHAWSTPGFRRAPAGHADR